MNSEQWRDIPGFEGLFQVSDMGQVKRLVDNYYAAGDRREWDGTMQAEQALKDFGARWNDAGTGWIDPKAEPDTLIVWVVKGGISYLPYTEWMTLRRSMESAKEAVETYWGTLKPPLEWVESAGGAWRAYGKDDFDFQIYPHEVKE